MDALGRELARAPSPSRPVERRRPSRDAPPGLYSVLVTGVATTTGVALVEIYEIP